MYAYQLVCILLESTLASRCRKYYSTSSHQCNIIYILRLVVYIQNDFVCILQSTHTYHHLLCIQYGYVVLYIICIRAYYTRVCSTMHTRVLASMHDIYLVFILCIIVLIHTHACTCSYAYSYQSSSIHTYIHTYEPVNNMHSTTSQYAHKSTHTWCSNSYAQYSWCTSVVCILCIEYTTYIHDNNNIITTLASSTLYYSSSTQQYA